MIETRSLIKSVHTTEGLLTILKGIDLRITEGEVVAIVGASGSGKSTLLGLMAGLDGASSGDVLLGGQNFSAMDEEQRAMLRGQLVGFVFQSFQLLPSLTALENAMLPIELKGDSLAREKAQQLLSRVGLQERCHHYPNQLSGGEQQGLPLLGHSRPRPKFCSRMSLRAIWIPRRESGSSNCCLILTASFPRLWCWSPMMRDSPSAVTESSSW